ncbi:MAG: ABC transporter permease [Vicinamibacterales bacterium]
MSDLRLAFRMMGKQPGMALLAVVALALGIGLTTTMFSIVNGAVLRGLPFPEAHRILHFAPFDIAEQDDGPMDVWTYAEFERRQTSFSSIAGFSIATANLVGPAGVPERYIGTFVTANTFRLLQVQPLLGRDFRDEESQPGAEPVVIIGYRVWQDLFEGDPDIVGKPVRMNGTIRTVVGVMPQDFLFPVRNDVWAPLTVTTEHPAAAGGPGPPDAPGRLQDSPGLEVIGRLRDGVTRAQASAEMATIWHQLQLEFPTEYDGYTTEVKTYIEEFIGSETVNALYTMLAAVFGVLIIACVNVANLVLARAAERAREIAVRTAIGAGRWRVVRQMLVEVLVLSAVGAAIGVGIASVGIDLFNRAIVDTSPPFWIDIRIDGTVLLFVTLATVVAALAAGIVPALRASRADLMLVMNDEGRGNSSMRMGRFSRGLVVVEMALSFGLLVVSGLVIQSLVNLGRADFGFAAADVWSGRVTLSAADYPGEDDRRQVADAILARMRALPGVRNAAVATGLPLGGPYASVRLPGRQYATERDYERAHSFTVSDGYFETLRIPVRGGRSFDSRDTATGTPTAIVNESFARQYFPDGAIGRQLALATGAHQDWRTIVGIVPDLGVGRGPGDTVSAAIYLPMAQVPVQGFALVAATSGAPLELTAAARDAVRAVDPNLPLYGVTTAAEAIESSTWAFWVFGSLFLAFGAAALVMATVGLYGVMAFAVSRRTQEIGVRMAMGAGGADVLRMVLRQGVTQVLIGILLGVGLAAALSNAMYVLFFGVTPFDPVTFVGVGAVLAATGIAACLVPALRAARTDPMTALRYQ